MPGPEPDASNVVWAVDSEGRIGLFVGNSPLSFVDPWGGGLFPAGSSTPSEPDNSGLSNLQLADATIADLFGPSVFIDRSTGYDPLAGDAPGGSISYGKGSQFVLGQYTPPDLESSGGGLAGDLAMMLVLGMVTDGLGDLLLPEAGELLAENRLKNCAVKGGALTKVPNFANSRLAAEHYAKHVYGIIDKGGVQTLSKYGADMPEFSSFQEYVQAARKFSSGPTPSRVLEGVRANGDVLRFDPATGNFGITTPQGTIRTFFRPSEGADYFYGQFK